MPENLPIIGLHNKISIPKALILGLDAKTDTGAYNCSIDCSFMEEIETKSGDKQLTYILLNNNHPLYTGKLNKTKKYKSKKVRSSNGTETVRYQVKLKIELQNSCIRATFNLSDRSKMRFPVLLGRRIFSKRYLIDVSLDSLSKPK